MDSAINSAARALAAGDPLAALDRVALRDDPPGLALRGVAMAQLGELTRARELLRSAARKFGAREAVARARCIVAQREIALAQRELGGSAKALDDAIAVLQRHGDTVNVTHARLLGLRRLLLLGRVDEARGARQQLALQGMPPMLRAIAAWVDADLAQRAVRAREAEEALERALAAAHDARIPALLAEIEAARERLRWPAARRVDHEGTRAIGLPEVEDVLASEAWIVDAGRRAVVCDGGVCSLARRPVLFALVEALARAHPSDVSREELLQRALEGDASNLQWRTRLRVEIGRLRSALGALGTVTATDRGFVLEPSAARVVVLLPPADGEHAAVLAVLADGAAWSTSALALALGVSQRTVQRALWALHEQAQVETFGRGRAQRWLATPASGSTTALLLPGVGVAG